MMRNNVNMHEQLAAFEKFNQSLGRARTIKFFQWLSPKDRALEDFQSLSPLLRPARRYLGMREVPVGRIVGSVGRSADFDRDFRPLGSHLRDRWVSVYLLAANGDWPPVRLYKAGDRYFVEDGHNRVSVAHALDMPKILAEVWEYAFHPVRRDSPGGDRPYSHLPLAEG
jgi:hypothetical protein